MKLKRTAAAVVAAVMAFTAVATPLGDNIPARLKKHFPQVRITALRTTFILLH